MRRAWAISLAVVVVGGLAAGAAVWNRTRANAAVSPYRTAAVTRGDVKATISATGTIEPEEVVDIGAQVAGQILSFGTDLSGKPIDYGSVVDAGTVLARIDDSFYAADAATAKAALDLANAGVVRAVADLGQMKAKLDQASRDWDRAQKLGPGDALAQSAFDAYRSAFDVAKANVAVDEAAIVQQRAAVAQAQAALQRAQRNLDYCVIKSPVKGVIIDRRVNIGQTVVASLNAPSLFLLAKDLTRMQVWVSVNEADIASIKAGQKVTFTVDAFPDRVGKRAFVGEVRKVRLNAAMTQNVVTYTVEIATDNSNGILLPYLTANAAFETGSAKDVLLAPNAALRWTPSAAQLDPAAQPAAGNGNGKSRANGGGRRGGAEAAPGDAAAAQAPRQRGTLYVADGPYVRPIRVRLGLTDGASTEVSGDGVTEGMEVVTGDARPQDKTAAGDRSPFTPQIRRR